MLSGLVSHDPMGEHYLRAFHETTKCLVKYYDSDFGILKAVWSPENFCRLFIDAYTSCNLTVDELVSVIKTFCQGYLKLLDGSPVEGGDLVKAAAHTIVSSYSRRFIFKNSSCLYDVPYSSFDGDFCAKFFWERQIQTFLSFDVGFGLRKIPDPTVEEANEEREVFVVWLEERGFVKEELLDGNYVSRTFRLSNPRSLESTCALVVPQQLFEDDKGQVCFSVLFDGSDDAPPLLMDSVGGGYVVCGIAEHVNADSEPFSDFCDNMMRGMKNRDFRLWLPKTFLKLKGMVRACDIDFRSGISSDHYWFLNGEKIKL